MEEFLNIYIFCGARSIQKSVAACRVDRTVARATEPAAAAVDNLRRPQHPEKRYGVVSTSDFKATLG